MMKNDDIELLLNDLNAKKRMIAKLKEKFKKKRMKFEKR